MILIGKRWEGSWLTVVPHVDQLFDELSSLVEVPIHMKLKWTFLMKEETPKTYDK